MSSDTIYQGGVSFCGAPSDWCRRTNWNITKTFIEKESGCCCTGIENIQLLRVKDLSFKGGCCCCGSCASIIVYSSDATSPEIHIKGIPNAKEVFHQLRDAVSNIHSNAKLELNV